ncbi:hypothetical protein EUX98_g2316 [Antrodiella citrinella]|uniref:Uncharacterized protein n=1 Tax=Antrodiella citrinella TaxID=2447956 RepID=A0A4S4N1J5_9APHY|nr:hypothetical protein EUX98_g2316 [Antrodiella citrinella]
MHQPAVKQSAPIFRLPDEVLYAVFMMSTAEVESLVYDYPSATGCDVDEVRALQDWHEHELFKVTLVCRLWREVALRYAAYWTTIYTSHLRTVSTLLARSRQVPLSMHWISGSPAELGPLKLVLNEYHRIRELDLALTTGCYYEMSGLIPPSAPCLTSLTLSNVLYGEQPQVPTLWDDCDMPNLRKLALIDYDLSHSKLVGTCLTPRLTHLDLQGILGFDIPMHMDAIRQMSGLVRLVLVDRMQLIDDSDDEEICLFADSSILEDGLSQDIMLPHLEYLRLALPSCALAAVLDRLIIPASSTVELVWKEETPSEPPYDDLVQRITKSVLSKFAGPTVIDGGRRPAPRSAAVVGGAPIGMRLSLWPFVMALDEFHAGTVEAWQTMPGIITISVKLYDDSIAEAESALVLALFSKLPVAAVESLSYFETLLEGEPRDTCVRFFQAMPLLTGVHCMNSVSGLRRALSYRVSGEAHGSDQHYLLPLLKRIFVENLDENAPSMGTQLMALLLAIRNRYSDGLTLDTFEVEGLDAILSYRFRDDVHTTRGARWIRDQLLNNPDVEDLQYPGLLEDHSSESDILSHLTGFQSTFLVDLDALYKTRDEVLFGSDEMEDVNS